MNKTEIFFIVMVLAYIMSLIVTYPMALLLPEQADHWFPLALIVTRFLPITRIVLPVGTAIFLSGYFVMDAKVLRTAYSHHLLALLSIAWTVYAFILYPGSMEKTLNHLTGLEERRLLKISTALTQYEENLGHFPKTDTGLAALLKNPGNIQSWKGPYFQSPVSGRDPFTDVWGNPYIYRCPGNVNSKGYDLWSAGPDKRNGTKDDVLLRKDPLAG